MNVYAGGNNCRCNTTAAHHPQMPRAAVARLQAIVEFASFPLHQRIAPQHNIWQGQLGVGLGMLGIQSRKLLLRSAVPATRIPCVYVSG